MQVFTIQLLTYIGDSFYSCDPTKLHIFLFFSWAQNGYDKLKRKLFW